MSELAVSKKPGTIPKGTYDTRITGVAIVPRKDDGRYSLRVIVKTVRLDRDLVVWRGPADTAEQLDGERVRLEDLMTAGEVVPVKVWHSPAGQQTAFASTSNGNGHHPQAELAHAAHQKVLQGLSAARLGLTVAAEGCFELQQSEGWKTLGYDTLGEYLAAPEITLKRTEFFAMAAIWKAYVLEGGVDPTLLRDAARSKLEIPLRALGLGAVSVEQAVEDATSMPRADLRIKYAGLVGGDEAEGRAERAESRRRDVEVTEEMVERGARAAVSWFDEEPLLDGVGLAQAVLRAALERAR